MTIRSIWLAMCVALICLGTIAGCTPAPGDGGGSAVVQAPPNYDLAPPDESARTDESDFDVATGEESADPVPVEQASPGTTTAGPEFPSFGAPVSPSTTTPISEIPSFDDQAPPGTTAPNSDVPALDG